VNVFEEPFFTRDTGRARMGELLFRIDQVNSFWLLAGTDLADGVVEGGIGAEAKRIEVARLGKPRQGLGVFPQGCQAASEPKGQVGHSLIQAPCVFKGKDCLREFARLFVTYSVLIEAFPGFLFLRSEPRCVGGAKGGGVFQVDRNSANENRSARLGSRTTDVGQVGGEVAIGR
jgi:hypothetical protein